MSENIYTPVPFTLNCQLWKIAKHVPGILKILSTPLKGIKGDIESYYDKLNQLSAFVPKAGEFADIDHLIPAQTDHRFRGKVTT